MSVLRDVEQSDAGARIEPRVAVGERRQRVDQVPVFTEVAAILQIRAGHLLELRGGLPERAVDRGGHLGGRQRLREQPLVPVGLLDNIGHASRSGGCPEAVSVRGAPEGAIYKRCRHQE